MKINPLGAADAISKYKLNSVKNNKKISAAAQSDKLELSEDAIGISAALKAIKESGDVRVNKVESIKSAIDSGDYNIDSYKVADSMLKGSRINYKA